MKLPSQSLNPAQKEVFFHIIHNYNCGTFDNQNIPWQTLNGFKKQLDK